MLSPSRPSRSSRRRAASAIVSRLSGARTAGSRRRRRQGGSGMAAGSATAWLGSGWLAIDVEQCTVLERCSHSTIVRQPEHCSTEGGSMLQSDPTAGGAPAIEARDLVKTYPGGVRALDGLGFTVAPGTVFGLLGPNGAGKSTTVKILTTLSRPDSGVALVAGIDVSAQPDRVRHAIGCVAQKSAVDREATGRENLELQGHLYGLRGRALKRRADGLLERLGLAEAADRVARTWSGGMQRKLDVAMGLIHQPQVLFLDEPTTGLDPEARADMWREGSPPAQQGVTILLTTP